MHFITIHDMRVESQNDVSQKLLNQVMNAKEVDDDTYLFQSKDKTGVSFSPILDVTGIQL